MLIKEQKNSPEIFSVTQLNKNAKFSLEKKFNNNIENCNMKNLKNIFKEIYKRIFIPFYIPILMLIPLLLITSSKEDNKYSKLIAIF